MGASYLGKSENMFLYALLIEFLILVEEKHCWHIDSQRWRSRHLVLELKELGIDFDWR